MRSPAPVVFSWVYVKKCSTINTSDSAMDNAIRKNSDIDKSDARTGLEKFESEYEEVLAISNSNL